MANLQAAVKKFSSDLAEKVETFVNDIAVLEVRTYSTPYDQVQILVANRPDVEGAAKDGKIMLRAYTEISLDGDMNICVPQAADGLVDNQLWEIHSQTVEQAMANRAKMIKAVGDAAAAALEALKKAGE